MNLKRHIGHGLESPVGFGQSLNLNVSHQTILEIFTKRLEIISISATKSTCRTETAAIVGSIFHSRYCIIATGSVT
ncbi:hypothetical protein D9M69_640730 [compost metagenome]